MSLEKVKEFGIDIRKDEKDITLEEYSLVDLLDKMMDKIKDIEQEIVDLKKIIEVTK